MDNRYKLGTREMLAIILLSIGTKFTDYTPDLLFMKTFMSAWMVPLISAGIFFLPLFLLVRLLNTYQMSLTDLVKNLMGKYVGTVLCLFLFLFSLIGTSLLINNYSHIIVTLYFPQSPKGFIQFVLILVCFLIAYGGAYTIGRTAWMILLFIKITLLILLVLAFSVELNTAYIFPLFGEGVDVLLKESFLYSSIFVECMLLATLIPYMKKTKYYSKAALIGIGIVAIEISLFFFYYIIMFDASVYNMTLPFQHMTRTVRLGRFISNTEGYFLFGWLLASFVKYAMYLFVTTSLYSQTFKIKSTRSLLLPVTVLVYLLGMLPENAIKGNLLYRDVNLYIGSFFFVALPFVLWLFSLRKKASGSS
ncbi:GerAB/ArcD/ProY family transporter [Pontibacillus marinus]|uniref:Spore germination protein n=1 Tax=Pontibacillus marinus BH030004 = DSM 16465 TaxID=1385511 RepID=A0A0A5I7U7_9BACI|nr:GerAB/ArcD/ProY family transporter [Pontibacillus marinus]KGX91912.1 hypothetical protein N783_01040 [Pontibacillus marinus BH030004 = DSM 16465]